MPLNEDEERLIDESIESFKKIINHIQTQIERLEKQRMPKYTPQIDLFDISVEEK